MRQTIRRSRGPPGISLDRTRPLPCRISKGGFSRPPQSTHLRSFWHGSRRLPRGAARCTSSLPASLPPHPRSPHGDESLCDFLPALGSGISALTGPSLRQVLHFGSNSPHNSAKIESTNPSSVTGLLATSN